MDRKPSGKRKCHMALFLSESIQATDAREHEDNGSVRGEINCPFRIAVCVLEEVYRPFYQPIEGIPVLFRYLFGIVQERYVGGPIFVYIMYNLIGRRRESMYRNNIFVIKPKLYRGI